MKLFGIHPQSTRSRQGEQRNPEVELEVRQVVFIPIYLSIYCHGLTVGKDKNVVWHMRFSLHE